MFSPFWVHLCSDIIWRQALLHTSSDYQFWFPWIFGNMHAILEKSICNALNTFILFKLMHRMYYTPFTRKIWLKFYKKLVMHVEVGRSNNRSCFQRRLKIIQLTKTHRRIFILERLRLLRLLKPTVVLSISTKKKV